LFFDPVAMDPKLRPGTMPEHSAETLLPLVYDELRKLARARLARERPGQTLQPTALVHEAYLRLRGVGDDGSPPWAHRGHFFGAAAEAMRRILIERARRYQRQRHGGELRRTTLQDREAVAAFDGDREELLALDQALTRLEDRDAAMAQVVKLRYFAGLTVAETAAALETSPRSVNRLWTDARAWLFREVHGRPGGGPAP
jgi:RNA polymerase sigma factor (TIGR02999 family)